MKPFYRQPQIRPTINWSNPLTRGIIFAAIGGNPIDLKNNKVGTLVGTVTIQPERRGKVFRTDTGAANRIDFTVPTDVAGSGYSFGSIATHVSNATFQYLIFRELAGVSSGVITLLMGINGSNHLQVSFGTNGFVDGTTVIADNSWDVFSASTPPDGDTVQNNSLLFINGIKESFTSGTAGGTVKASIQNNVILNGRPSDNNRQLKGAQALSVHWHRVLSEDEHRSFAQNPWQIFSFSNNAIINSVAAPAATTNRQYSAVFG